MDFTRLRENYPALQRQTYLNTASCGIVSRATAQTAQQCYQELLEQGGVPREEWYQRLTHVRREVANWLGGNAEEFALLPNFSIAQNYLVQALSSFRRVLLLDSDYSSVTLPWLLHQHELYYFSADHNGFFDLDRIEKEVKANNINVLAISHVQYSTGFCIDLQTLGQQCREWGVLLVVDATQSLGAIPIDLQQMPVDVLMASGYKWTAAGFGNAVLYVRRELHSRLAVAAVGNNSFDDFPSFRSRDEISFSPRRLEVGHYDFSSFFALQQAVRDLQTVGTKTIRWRIKELTNYLYEQLPASATVLSTYAPEHRSGITVIVGDATLEKKLLARGIATSARTQGLRISLHFYNNRADIDHLCGVLGEL